MPEILSTVKTVLSDDQVQSWEAIPGAMQHSIRLALSPSETLPAGIVYPRTQEELAAVMACAHQHRWRVLPCGSGSKLRWGGLVTGIDLVISTQHMKRLVEHAVGDLTFTAEAGMQWAELKKHLGSANQFFAVDPAYPNRATLGGIVATGDTGSLRQRYSSVRDMLIGITFVRYDGQVAKAGGRVVKNVAGYDLMKLMTGSYGTLGVIAQVTFRTYPQPETSQTVLLSGRVDALQTLLSTVRRSTLTPVALDVLSPELMLPWGNDDLGVAVRFQSITAGVEQQCDRLLKLGQSQGLTGQILQSEQDMQFWQGIETALWTDRLTEETVIAKVGLLPNQALSFLQTLESLTEGLTRARIHASSGLGTIRLTGSTAILQKLRSQCEAAQGYLSLLVAPKEVKAAIDVWGYHGNALNLMRHLKTQFDPDRLLSPGRFVGGL